MNKILKKMLFSSTILAGILIAGNMGSVNASADELTDENWVPRSIEEIKESMKQNTNIYTIVKGDTLSGISEASGITISDLVAWNDIANQDLIYAGNTLIFNNDGTVTDSNGNDYQLSEESQKNRAELTTQPSNQTNENTTQTTNRNNNASKNTAGTTTNNSTTGNTSNGSTGETTKPEEKPSTPATPETPVEKPDVPVTPPVTPENPETPNKPENPTDPETPKEPVWVPEQVIPEQGHWEDGTKQVWVPKIVTIVDQPEYTTSEWAYTLIRFTDGTEFKLYHNLDTPEGQAEYEPVQDYIDKLDAEGKPNNYTTRDFYEDVTHPAITHTEDQGGYETVADPDNKVWVVDVPEQVIPGHWA